VAKVSHVLEALHPLVRPGNHVVIVASTLIVVACTVAAIVFVLRNTRRRHNDREVARSFVQQHEVEALGGYLDRDEPDDENPTHMRPPVSEPNLW